MDISKFRFPTLDGPSWGLWLNHIQSTTRILNIWDVMRGDIIAMNLPTIPPMRDLLQKPSPVGRQATVAKIAAYTTAKAIRSKKNAQGLGLIQATVSNVIWQKHQSLGTMTEVLDAGEPQGAPSSKNR